MKKQLLSLGILIWLALPAMAQGHRILVFSKTTGYRHESIGVGKLAIMKLGHENGFAVDTTEEASLFTDANLANYDAVVFLSTTHDVLNDEQQQALVDFIHAGKGFVGIHAAADTEYDWPWYGKMLGAWFQSHPKQQEAKATETEAGAAFFKKSDMPKVWTRFDELYNYKEISPDIKPLYLLDESSYQGGEDGDFHPIVWMHDFEGGRVFYTGFGHTDESYSDKLFLSQLLTGINYAIGTKKNKKR